MKNLGKGIEKYKDSLIKILNEVKVSKTWDSTSLQKILRKYPKEGNRMFRKDELVGAYHKWFEKDSTLESRIRMKPTRTNSGVAIVTVLTKPFGCPGNCIYCPNDPQMPKSYISSEPGAQRALTNKFDPYAQVFNRLVALKNIGHNIEKVELIILGGTWNFYPQLYRKSFVYECYRALNDLSLNTTNFIEPKEGELPKVSWEDIFEQQKKNETGFCRNVGFVVETRPDYINIQELIDMRKLGCTKVQIGIQSLSDRILKKNNIGRSSRDTKRAFKLLRLLGFKIHGHWMPNLYGSNPQKDVADFKKLWKKNYHPDELKIYPTSIIPGTKLNELYEKKLYKPYSEKELSKVLKTILPLTPRYCRLTRIVRDIPSNEIVAGNKKTNFRQIVEQELEKEGVKIQDIRSREIKGESVRWEDLELEVIAYKTSVSKEVFLSYNRKTDDKICGFLRLSLPKRQFKNNPLLSELKGCSMIREVHVYGKVVGIEKKSKGASQHLGLGKKLIRKAEYISKNGGFESIAVISAIGTKEYYRKRGFEESGLYMRKELTNL